MASRVRVLISLLSRHKFTSLIISASFIIILLFGDYLIISTLILFLTSLSALYYLIFLGTGFRIKYPLLHKWLLTCIFFFISVITGIILIAFLLGFISSVLSKVYYYLKVYIVKFFSSGNFNSSSSQGSGPGGNSNNPNNGGSGTPNYFNNYERWRKYRDRFNANRRRRTIARRNNTYIARGDAEERAKASGKIVEPSNSYSVAATKKLMSLSTKK